MEEDIIQLAQQLESERDNYTSDRYNPENAEKWWHLTKLAELQLRIEKLERKEKIRQQDKDDMEFYQQ